MTVQLFIFLYLYLLSLINALEYIQKIEFSLKFIEQDIDDRSSLFQFKLRWKDIIYSCHILPNKSITKYKCDDSNLIQTVIIDNNDNNDEDMMLIYDSSSRIFIKSIIFWIKDEYNNNLFFYKIDKFCVAVQYNYLLNPMKNPSKIPPPIITTLRGGFCKHFNIEIKSDQFIQHQLYRNIAIGNPSKFKYHKIIFIKDMYSYKNQSIEVLILPPQIQSFSIKTTDLSNDANPQTKDPVNLYLTWFYNVYECTVYPKNPNQIYKCDVNDKSVKMSTYTVHEQADGYGEFKLLIVKDEKLKDSVVIDEIIITDKFGIFYGFNSFCIPLGLYANSRICSHQHTEENEKNHCNGFVDYKIRSDSFIKCDISCLDTDYCWKHQLFYYFVDDFLLHPNELRQAKVRSAIFANLQIYNTNTSNSAHDKHENAADISLEEINNTYNINTTMIEDPEDIFNVTLKKTHTNSTNTTFIKVSYNDLKEFVNRNVTDIIVVLIISLPLMVIALIGMIIILCCQCHGNGVKKWNVSRSISYSDNDSDDLIDLEDVSITEVSHSHNESQAHSLSIIHNDIE